MMSFEASSENSSAVIEFHYLYLLATAINILFFRLDPYVPCMT